MNRSRFVMLITLGMLISLWVVPAAMADIAPFRPSKPKRCKYNGKTYASGQQFKGKDGCNRCECKDGKVLCTAKACSDCKYGGTDYKHGASFRSQDGCNTCTCNNGGVRCTEKACAPSICRYKGRVYAAGKTFPAGDQCNRCYCYKGAVHCTKRSCAICFRSSRAYQEGQSYPVYDGCNRCVCHRGQFYCSQKSCKRGCRVGKMLYKHNQTFRSSFKVCTCRNGKVSCKVRKPVFLRPPQRVKPSKRPSDEACKNFYYKLCKKDMDCKAGYQCKDRSMDCRASICFCDKKTGKIGGCTLDCLRGYGICKKK
ncbi:MAG: hypothetical protein EP343_28165 [Deltaproteobacteria bacterium]|nr:MAG: hypothetical protein EP343_28165 [Deltaproteobacteria bacterium]